MPTDKHERLLLINCALACGCFKKQRPLIPNRHPSPKGYVPHKESASLNLGNKSPFWGGVPGRGAVSSVALATLFLTAATCQDTVYLGGLLIKLQRFKNSIVKICAVRLRLGINL
jgi:hypothetical protein